MANKYYSQALLLRKDVDEYILDKTKEKGWCSYSDLLDSCLKKHNIRISSSTKEGELAVFGDEYAYTKVLFITKFYLPKLESLNYICYYQTAAEEQEDNTELGSEPTEHNQAAYIPKEISSDIEQKLSYNMVISPEFKGFVKAKHQSLELKEAKKSSHIAIFAAVIACISALTAVVQLLCNIGNTCCQ